jgi:hypothetical protein
VKNCTDTNSWDVEPASSSFRDRQIVDTNSGSCPHFDNIAVLLMKMLSGGDLRAVETMPDHTSSLVSSSRRISLVCVEMMTTARW